MSGPSVGFGRAAPRASRRRTTTTRTALQSSATRGACQAHARCVVDHISITTTPSSRPTPAARSRTCSPRLRRSARRHVQRRRGHRGGVIKARGQVSRRRRAAARRRPRAATQGAAALRLAAPAAVRQACAGLGGAPAVAAACADALRHSDDARWQLAHPTSRTRPRVGRAASRAPKLRVWRRRSRGPWPAAAASRRTRGPSAPRRSRASASSRRPRRRRRSTGATAASSRPSSASPPRHCPHNFSCAPTRTWKRRRAPRPWASRRPRSRASRRLRRGRPAPRGARRGVAAAEGAVACVALRRPSPRRRGASGRAVRRRERRALIAGMPALLDALAARDGAVLVPFGPTLRPRRRAGCSWARALALATFSQIVLDDDARADLARACARLCGTRAPRAAGRRRARRLPRGAPPARRRRSSGGGAPEAARCLRVSHRRDVGPVPGQGDAPRGGARAAAPATTLGGRRAAARRAGIIPSRPASSAARRWRLGPSRPCRCRPGAARPTAALAPTRP